MTDMSCVMASFACEDITSTTDVVVISSDEDTNDRDDDEVKATSGYRPVKSSWSTSPILIGDSDEELPQNEIEREQVRGKRGKYLIANPQRNQRIITSEPLVIDSDEEDLPDLCLSFTNEVQQMKQIRENTNFGVTECVAENEPPAKITRIETESVSQMDFSIMDTSSPFGMELPILKKRIAKSFLRGGFKGRSLNACNMRFVSCYETHQSQPKSVPTPVQSKVLFETMFEDENLQPFALRAMAYRTVSRKHYLDPSLLDLLLQYLFGSEQKQELPDAEGLHLGMSILNKLLTFHPPCKPGMHHIYLKMCQNYFSILLQKARTLLENEPCKAEGVTIQKNIQQGEKENENVDSFYDYTSVIRKKAMEKRDKYLKLTKADKIRHLSILLEYFTKVMEHSFLVWSIRHWRRKSSALFRKDICPLLSEIVWGSSTWSSEWGSVNNSKVQDLFYLYCASSEETSLHKSFGSVIAIGAAILHRKEICIYPEMGQMTRAYAYKLYMQIKSSTNVEANLKNVYPDWLKFHIASFFLGVEEPANFFKLKEGICKALRDKDRGFNHSTFCVDTVCLEAIKAMMGMVELKSSKPEECDLVEKIIDENSSWFDDMLQEEKILNNLKMIKHTLNIPYVKEKKWYFDGFESCSDS